MGNYCANCSAPLPRPRQPSELGQQRRERTLQRQQELRAFQPPTGAARQGVEAAFERFMKEDGATGNIFEATPQDVVSFLVARDETGRTVVHDPACTLWGQKIAGRTSPACECPVRASADALDTCRGRLQAIFRDAGRPAPWNPHARAGNPCIAPEVDAVVAWSKLEQLAAGTRVVQAALVDVSIFRKVMDHVYSAWSRASRAGDHLAAAMYARDAMFYVLLWESGLRASNALNLLEQQLKYFPREGAEAPRWLVQVGVTKTARSPQAASSLVMADDGSKYSLWQARAAWLSSLDELGLAPVPGQLFRDVLCLEDGATAFGGRAKWAVMDRRFRAVLSAVGVPLSVTLHSFHGSRAAREAAAGVPPEVTIRGMVWSREMYDHYVKDRQVLSAAQLAPPVEPQPRVGARRAAPVTGPVEAVARPEPANTKRRVRFQSSAGSESDSDYSE